MDGTKQSHLPCGSRHKLRRML